jgi:hypothetical protein
MVLILSNVEVVKRLKILEDVHQPLLSLVVGILASRRLLACMMKNRSEKEENLGGRIFYTWECFVLPLLMFHSFAKPH